ncbi:unnamed protein product [Medioppia subpectinata]|uniref:Uncharacterized protein n=1 Tax=Medioppia subpectinata TaxID=1979941 RepID=A0A7R9KGV2_9ACAR|nr:unnamed protein product [Medioppia subpectinata]CAG2101958.1 unnamed protein product [Medioppia subpectinata]
MKVLVDLNGCENYSIRIDRTDSAVVLPFNQVYNEIRKQIKHNITKHSHVFEIFDTDFNEYCVIPSDEHVIENLSRLRVRPKTVNNESIGLGINRDSNVGHKYSHKIQYEKNELNLSENYINKSDDSVYNEDRKSWTAGGNTSLNICINSDINSHSVPAPEPQSATPKLPQKLAQNNGKPFNVGNGMNKMMNTGSPVSVSPPLVVPNGHSSAAPTQANKSIISTPIPSLLTPGSHPSAPINYLDVELNSDTFATTGSSPHMPYITFTACVGTVWVIGIMFVDDEHRAFIQLMHILSNNGGNHPDFIVKQMAKSGFDDWDYHKCLNYFYNALELYKKTLANCPNRETAATVYPLFNTMGDPFVPYFLMTTKEYAKLNELKRLFAAKCDECLTTTVPTISEAPVAVIVADNGSACNRTPELTQTNTTVFNTDTRLIAANPMAAPVDPPGCSDQNHIDYLALRVTGKSFVTNTSSPHLPYVTAIVKVRDVWYRIGHFANAYQLALNRLLQLVDKHRPTDGRPMTDVQWVRVAAHMPPIRDCNEHEVVFDPKLCQNYLQNAMDLYKKTLEVCPDMDRAGTAFPMFYTLHVFSPKSVVSDAECREIARLRELFAHRCGTGEAYIGGSDGPPVPTRHCIESVLEIAPVLLDTLVTTLTTGSSLPAPSDSVSVSRTQPMSADHYWPNHSVAVNELDELLSISAKITLADIFPFAHLCRSVAETVKTVGPLIIDNQELFWSHVSQLMLDTGYGSLNKSIYRLLFTDHVTKYYVIVSFKVFPGIFGSG